METSELPKNIKWVNVIILMMMVMLTIGAIEPWTAWSVSPDAHDYGWNRFSYFTVQSNMIAVVVYMVAIFALIRNKGEGRKFPYLRGGAVLYMLVTAIVSALLLKNSEVNPDPGHFYWNVFVLHELGPFFIVMWWLLWPSRLPVTPRRALIWLVFPILWTCYTFIRVAFTDWYPYPFLNPAKVGGYDGVVLYMAGIAVFFIILSQLLAWISRVRVNNRTLY